MPKYGGFQMLRGESKKTIKNKTGSFKTPQSVWTFNIYLSMMTGTVIMSKFVQCTFKVNRKSKKKKIYFLLKKYNVVLNIQMCVYSSKVPKSEPYTTICEWGESTGKQLRALW